MSTDRDQNDPGRLERLLARAGRRLEPPAGAREAAYRSTLVAWQEAVQGQRRSRILLVALAAATTAAAVGLLWLAVELVHVTQEIAATAADGSGRVVGIGESFEATDGRGIAFRTAGGHGLRLAPGARLRFDASDRVELEAGRAYFESTANGEAAPLRIKTRYGEVRHVGTRYIVEVDGERMWVRVRDGQVAVRTSSMRSTASAGTEVSFDRKGHEASRRAINTFGSAWGWAEALAPPTRVDGRSLFDVLEEIAFESGRTLEFSDESVHAACRHIELRGPFLDLPVGDRLFAVLVTTGFEAVENGDRIIIRRRTDAAIAARSADAG